jgi:hypothetical protein
MKVPNSAEDVFIPVEINEHGTLREQRQRRDEHWARLKRARLDFNGISGNYPKCLEEQYGLQVHMPNGMITDDYTVVDEKKYLIYLLKYSQ